MPSTEPERTSVAVGLVFDERGRVLIGQRNSPDAYRGKWEFPGGKIKPQESDEDALNRELWEEIGIRVRKSNPFMSFAYDYPEQRVMLIFRSVDNFLGTPIGREHQVLKWVDISKLIEFDMLAPNRAVIKKLLEQCTT